MWRCHRDAIAPNRRVNTNVDRHHARAARVDAPDTSDYALVHHAIRSAGHALADAAERLTIADERHFDAFLRYWRGHSGEILTHHGIEDAVFFPALRERSPEAAAILDQLDREHHELDRLMDAAELAIGRVIAGAPASDAAVALRKLAIVMDAHLDVEDSEIIPAFQALFDATEYEAMTKEAIRRTGLGRQATFSVPYIVGWASPADRARLLPEAPLPMKLLYRVTRRRHARLAAAALGAGVFNG